MLPFIRQLNVCAVATAYSAVMQHGCLQRICLDPVDRQSDNGTRRGVALSFGQSGQKKVNKQNDHRVGRSTNKNITR